MTRILITAGVILVLALGAAAGSFANSTRITRGDAEAVFQARLNGGVAINTHDGALSGAPAHVAETRISPFVENVHYCALDWHVLGISVIVGGLRETYDQQQAVVDLAGATVKFELDGAPVQTRRTAVKRYNPASVTPDEQYWVNVGRILAPNEASVGPHTLAFHFRAEGLPEFDDDLEVTFVVDPAGSGTCL